ncbi:hypothetical protein [Methylobacterium sp. NEAU K]|uniref:hypothetical protein n=1 Tax=Methylobacterium sp. NEAU K TaxID=3064946 RepID=UPI002736818A|nr:hypothetical protein [Methylobacterium sp. NEAU K]MDP4006520.1 hypothetical protein [Methylobacterium sp. NEAU K]
MTTPHTPRPVFSFNSTGEATNIIAASLPRQRRRAMQRVAADAERITDADRRFFERFPHRSYRYRRAGHPEMAQLEAVYGAPIITEPGSVPFILIKNLAPGVRMRAFLPGPDNEDGSSATDEELALLWHDHCRRCPGVAEREAQLQVAMRLPGGPLHEGGI